MSASTQNDEPLPWPTKPGGARIPVSALKASAHLKGLDANARRAINERCRTWGSHLDGKIKELWPTNRIPPEWITVQRKEQEELIKAVRKDVDELTRVDPFQKLRFEGEWFELRTAWESLSWWRKKGTLGAMAESPEPTPAVESSTAIETRPPSRVKTQTQSPTRAPGSRVSTRPWEC